MSSLSLSGSVVCFFLFSWLLGMGQMMDTEEKDTLEQIRVWRAEHEA